MKLEGVLVLDRKNDTLLYAGEAKVNITDWFFIKDNIVLKYVALTDGIVNLNRQDSTWNYQFLADYFSSPGTKKSGPKNTIKLDIKKIELTRVKIYQHDEWIGTDMLVSLNKLDLDAEQVDMGAKVIKLNSLTIDGARFAQMEYEGKRPPKKKRIILNDEKETGGLQWNTDDWAIKIKDLNITDGGLAIENVTDRPIYADKFDDKHIIFSDINAKFKDFSLLKDTLSANLTLSAKNRSGFEVKKLSAGFKFTPVMMEFNKLDVTTNKSHLSNYYSMRYKNFEEDMSDFTDSVRITGDFKNAEVNSDDIAYFAPELKTWKRKFILNGKASGTIADLKGRDINIASGNSFFNGDFSLKGLPHINKTLIEIKSNDLKTSYQELSSFIPALKKIDNPDVKALGNIRFKGIYSGTVNLFVTKGTIATDLGTLETDIQMSFPENSPPVYTGKVSTTSFNLGHFIDDPKIGRVSFTGDISGKAFNTKTMSLTLNGNIKSLEFNNYNYHNIIAKGTLKNKMFTGSGSIDDPNLKINEIEGTIDLSKKVPQFNVTGTVVTGNLKTIRLLKDDYTLNGKFNLNFSGDNIDNFMGNARVYDAVLTINTKKLSFDSLVINSYTDNTGKHLTLVTNELEASVNGDFKVVQIPDAFKLLLNKYYPSYIEKPKKNVPDQNFTFNIITRNVADYLSIFTKNVTGFDNSTVSGNINLSQNILNLKADVPALRYKNISFSNVSLLAKGNNDTLSLTETIGETIINDSLKFPNTRINIKARNDVSDISIKTSGTQTLNEADLSLKLQTLPDGFRAYFNPSSFVINNKKWILEKGGELSVSKNIFTASEVKFVQDKQELLISTRPSSTGTNDIEVSLKEFNIGDVTPYLMKDPRVAGIMTGKVTIRDPFKNLSVIFDTKTEQTRFEDDSIGVIQTTGEYSSATGKIKAKVISANDLYKFQSDLEIDLSDSAENQLNTIVNIDHSDLHFLNTYLNSIFNGISGSATGVLNISGKFKAPKITGQVRLDGASMTVIYTRCKYILNDNSLITFNPDEIDLGTLKIKDTLNHTATVSGIIYHQFFNNLFFSDVNITTDRSGGQPGKFLLLNTAYKDNKQFYGYMIGDATVSLNGPESDMRMYITGEPTDSSHIYLPTTETAEGGKIDYIDFIKFGHEMKGNFNLKKQSNLKVELDITANPFVKIDVILDDVTGDVIKAQGRGRLHISAGTHDPLLIRGRYDLEQGEYTFNFQTFVKTPFTLQQGYIEWQGDPYLANLNVDAIYTASRVDQSSIPTSTGSNNTKGDIGIVFKLRGTLLNPRPDFELEFINENPLQHDPIANEYLKTRLQSDKVELNKQVIALLLFGSFMTNEQRLLTTGSTVSFATRGVGQMISSTLSSSLTVLFQRLFKTNNLTTIVNLNTSDLNFQKGATQDQLHNFGSIGVRTTFLKNRLLINFGGDVNYNFINASSNSNSNFLFTPDVSIEYLITKDGKVRVIGFNKTDASLGDIAGITRRNRSGISLSYRKDFNSFTNHKKKKAIKKIEDKKEK